MLAALPHRLLLLPSLAAVPLDRGRLPGGFGQLLSVPTGNFGDILAGYYAQKLVLPAGRPRDLRFQIKNNVLTDFFKTGKRTKVGLLRPTPRPWNILVSSNLSACFDLSARTPDTVKTGWSS